MKKINPQGLTKKQNYKLLSGSIIPRPIAFVTTQSETGVMNSAPFSFFNVVNSAPPMIMISTTRSDGKRKDTAINIEQTRQFVVHITDNNIVEEVNKTAAPVDIELNELERTSLNLVNSEVIDVPGIAQAKVRMECKLDRIIPLGDKLEGSDLIIGEVVMFHVADDVYYEDSKINHETLRAVSRLAGNDYAHIGETFTIVRPSK